MIMPLIIFLISSLSVIAMIIPSMPDIIDRRKKGFKKLKKHGALFFIAAALLVVLPIIQYYFQKSIEENNSANQVIEQEKRDEIMRIKYDSSLKEMKKVFDKSNIATTSTIADKLGEYKMGYDSATKRVFTLIKDSASRKTTIISGDDPTLVIGTTSENNKAFEIINRLNGRINLKLGWQSFDAGTSCFEIRCHLASIGTNNIIKYLGTDTPFDYKSRIAKDGTVHTFYDVVDNNDNTFFYIWAKGKYKNSDKTKPFEIDEVYYYNIKGNSFGTMKGYTREKVISTVLLAIDKKP